MFSSFKKRILLFPVVLCGLILLHALSVTRIQWIDKLEAFIYDQRLNFHLVEDAKSEHLVIVNIDEKSLAELGQWPWRRDVIAQLTNSLFEHYQIKVLGFDMVFSEPSDTTATEVLDLLAGTEIAESELFQQAYQSLKPQLDFDTQLAESFTDRNVVLGIVFEQAKNQDVSNKNQLPLPPITLEPEYLKQSQLVSAQSYIANLPVFHQQAKSSGFFQNSLLDSDGVFRRVPLVERFRQYVYPSLALEVARLKLDIEGLTLSFHQQGRGNMVLNSVNLGDKTIDVGSRAEVFVPYLGYQYSFQYFSALDILTQKIPAGLLQGKAVLVGTDAAGLLDLRTTPFAKAFPGVEVHANIVEGIIQGTIRSQPNAILKFEVGAILFATLVVLLISLCSDSRKQLFGLVSVIGAIIAASQYFWLQGIVVPTASTLVLTILLFISLTAFNLLMELRQKQSIVKQFGLYVPPDLVSDMAKSPEHYQLESQSKTLTVLFSDIRNFTQISEGLSPQALSEMMNLYLTEMTEIIHSNKGTIDKYIGDAIMAFWGAPVADTEHVRHAVITAMQMQAKLAVINKKFQANGWPSIQIGIGVNTGQMNVGNMGSEFRMAYTVMGDSVNLAARLEGLTKVYGCYCLLGQETGESLLSSEMLVRELDKVKVKGKSEASRIYELCPPQYQTSNLNNEHQVLPKAYLSDFQSFLNLYRQCQWQAALDKLDSLRQKKVVTESLYSLYQARIKHFKTSPPEAGWDGSFTYQRK
ncbi:CHASE2 domain-containing protein [Catenovulum maritimum]|uniref:Guanylate cyclase domain-containing protein n=1 Tax=Catenovulum maritimum TaxID=1513271 RepID=A0A0J8GZB1_9ALTE|nr:adenylate/guanylate cyclase domain-containing protein [Catenovulum maritimum]KMT66058.1 hypothetical protein XM47_06320 [Catenovulum maritimum]